MTIAYLVGWYYPDGRGGTEAYVAALARMMRAAGHRVLIAAPQAGLDGTRIYEHEGVPVFRYGVPAAPSRVEVRGSVAARGAEALHRWLERERPAIVHVHAFVTGLGLAEVRAARAVGARVFVTTHAARLGWICERGTMMQGGVALCDGVAEPAKCTSCVLVERTGAGLAGVVAQLPRAASAAGLALLPGRASTLTGMSALIADNLDRQHALLDEIEALVVLTSWARDAVIANGAPADRVVLNRLGCTVPEGGQKPSPERQPTTTPITVGYIGRFDAVKGLDVLAQAVRGLPAALPVRIVVRGPVATADEHAVLAAFRQIVGDDARVQIGDAVSRAELGDVLRSFDVLVCPSVTLEGGPTIAIEAHAVGTPVIGSRIGGLAELVADGQWGRLVPPGDADALGQAITEIARAPQATVDRWRSALPRARTMTEIAADTQAMYDLHAA